MLSDDLFDELKNLGAELDREDSQDGETQHPASEDRQQEMRPVHFCDPGGKDKDFERESGGHHARNDERQVAILFRETVDTVETRATDFLHDEGFAALVTDEVGNETADSRTRSTEDDIEQRTSWIRVYEDGDNRIHGDAKEGRVDERDEKDAPRPEWQQQALQVRLVFLEKVSKRLHESRGLGR